MQDLIHNDNRINYNDVIEKLQKQLGREINGVPVTVSENYDDNAIKIDINGQAVMMTLKQARDFLHEVNKAINLVSKNYRREKAKSK